MKKNLLFSIIAILVAFVGSITAVNGQVTTSAIHGKVTDQPGQAIPGASVTAVHLPTGTKYGTSTRTDGKYNLNNLKIGGPYLITVKFVGYSDQSKENVSLTVGEDYTFDFILKEASTTLEGVNVVAARPSDTKIGAGAAFGRKQIEQLPVINRSVKDLTKLTPTSSNNGFAGVSYRYNNFTVDGANFNSSFGVSSSLGGQTNVEPISLDAIEQIQVNIAPYDVRQGGFTGAGINTVTRSGTNEFKGTVYSYWKSPSVQGRHLGDLKLPKEEFSYNQRGISFGGPIIKNKLFFFANVEQDRRDFPSSSYRANRGEDAGVANVSAATSAELDQLSQFLKDKYGYNTGAYEGFKRETFGDKITARVDWNINDNNALSFKYFYMKSYSDESPSSSGGIGGVRGPGITGLPFQGNYYRQFNNFNIGIMELSSRFNNKTSNNLKIGYTAIRDHRESPTAGTTPFPLVDIANGAGQYLTSFGFEPFSANNSLKNNLLQLTDNLTINTGNHEIVLGFQGDYRTYSNGFAANYFGRYRFESLADFYESANNGTSTATDYELRYSALPNKEFPYAEINAIQLGAYVQDRISIGNDIKLTLGIRADLPIITSEFLDNPVVKTLTFKDGEKLDVSKAPKNSVLFSPRIGVNWDLDDNKETQLRFGTGLFTGIPPYVWLANQAGNNGVIFGSFRDATNKPFTNDVNAYVPENAAANTSYNLAVTSSDFKYPQIWRSNIALDQKLFFGIKGTVELLVAKDINAVYFKNVALPNTFTNLKGADNRIRYTATSQFLPSGSAQSATNPRITDAIVLDNSQNGYSTYFIAQLQKQFDNGLFLSVAYSTGEAKGISDGTSSQAASSWRDRSVSGDPNLPVTSYTEASIPNKVNAIVSYRKEYGKNFASSIGLVYDYSPASGPFGSTRFHYTYNGDLNNDGQNSNDLIYIPRNMSEVVLVPEGATDTRTSAQIWSDLENYINQDDYLKSRKGKYAERNGALFPYVNRLDLSFNQDFYLNVGGKRNTLRFSIDIQNFTNMLNKDWGVAKSTNRTSLMNFKGLNAAGEPTFSFPYLNASNKVPLTETFRDNPGIISRWSALFGVRYIFN